MRKPAQDDDTRRILSLVSAWERDNENRVSSLRMLSRRQLRKAVQLIAPLQDKEAFLMFESIGCFYPDDRLHLPLFQRFIEQRIDLIFERLSVMQRIRFFVLMAPTHQALIGAEDFSGSTMEQAMNWYFGDSGLTKHWGFIDIGDFVDLGLPKHAKRVRRDERHLAMLIGKMMCFHADKRISDDDLEWFGSHWRELVPFWSVLTHSGAVDRERAELMIQHQRDGGPSSLAEGLL